MVTTQSAGRVDRSDSRDVIGRTTSSLKLPSTMVKGAGMMSSESVVADTKKNLPSSLRWVRSTLLKMAMAVLLSIHFAAFCRA